MVIAVSEEAPKGIDADVPAPVVLNLTEQSTLQSLREYQHKDVNGNPIGRGLLHILPVLEAY